MLLTKCNLPNATCIQKKSFCFTSELQCEIVCLCFFVDGLNKDWKWKCKVNSRFNHQLLSMFRYILLGVYRNFATGMICCRSYAHWNRQLLGKLVQTNSLLDMNVVDAYRFIHAHLRTEQILRDMKFCDWLSETKAISDSQASSHDGRHWAVPQDT